MIPVKSLGPVHLVRSYTILSYIDIVYYIQGLVNSYCGYVNRGRYSAKFQVAEDNQMLKEIYRFASIIILTLPEKFTRGFKGMSCTTRFNSSCLKSKLSL